ncbi:GNAT family N-acetyltransferase [Streptomyces sp. NPDC051907]|uniref:GNAT family N-acetyltransferase n=1 Tax=Streptomyces sp. NPDC051907 TaxID=3155284 RepID=UPI00342A3BBE
MASSIRIVGDERLLSYAAGIRAVYASAFAAPPWDEAESMADAYLERLGDDLARPGFVAALVLDGDTVHGFCTAWTTPADFPKDRCHPQVLAALGPQRTRDWLCGAQEIDQLAVHARARGRRLGPALLDAVTAEAADGRSWLLTSIRAETAMDFYQRLGWHQATYPAPRGTGAAVFLGPCHPAAPATAGWGVVRADRPVEDGPARATASRRPQHPVGGERRS